MFLIKNIVLVKINKRYINIKSYLFMINDNAKEFSKTRKCFLHLQKIWSLRSITRAYELVYINF